MFNKSKFLFKLVLSSSLILGLQTSALALPGMKKQQALSWAKKHQYFANWIQSFSIEMYGEGILAYRQLDKSRFLDVYLGLYSPSSDYSKANVFEAVLQVTHKEYTGQSDHERMESISGIRYPSGWGYDKRPWQTKRCENIWSRDNKQASEFLTRVFSADIAKDFANSKLVYNGPTYIDGPDADDAYPYYPDSDLHKIVGRDYEGNPLPKKNIVIARDHIDVFKGRRFAYFVQDKEHGPSVAFDALQVKCSSLVIRPLDRINEIAGTLSINKKIYENR